MTHLLLVHLLPCRHHVPEHLNPPSEHFPPLSERPFPFPSPGTCTVYTPGTMPIPSPPASASPVCTASPATASSPDTVQVATTHHPLLALVVASEPAHNHVPRHQLVSEHRHRHALVPEDGHVQRRHRLQTPQKPVHPKLAHEKQQVEVLVRQSLGIQWRYPLLPASR